MTLLNYNFNPNTLLPGQVELFETLQKPQYKIILLSGGIGGGKTKGGILGLIYLIYGLKRVKVGRSWVVSLSYDQANAAKEHIESFGYAQDGGLILKYRQRDKLFQLPPPNENFNYYNLQLKSGKDVNLLKGATLDAIMLDEGLIASPELFEILLARLRDSNGCLIISSTPKGLTAMYRKIAHALEEHPDMVKVIYAKSRENKYISNEAINSLYKLYPGDLARQELEGQIVSLTGLAFPTFEDVLEAGKDSRNVSHLTHEDKLKLSEQGQHLMGIDFGYSKDHPFAITHICKVDKIYYILWEHKESGLTIDNMENIIRESPFFRYKPIIYADWAQPIEIETLAQRGLQIYPCDKDTSRIPSIRLIHSLITDNELKVSADCVELISEIKQAQLDSKGLPIRFYNDLTDAMRYGIFTYRKHIEAKYDMPPQWRNNNQLTYEALDYMQEKQNNRITGYNSPWSLYK
jgi:hypothetical protein